MSLIERLHGFSQKQGVFGVDPAILAGLDKTILVEAVLKEYAENLDVPLSEIIDVSDYEVQGEHITTGSSLVSLARSLDNERFVIKAAYEPVKIYLDILLNEFRVYRALGEHPQIPTCFGLAVDPYIYDDEFFLVLQDLGEPDVGRKLIQEGRIMDSEELRAFGSSVLEVLDYVHAQGVFHRDLKPGNVILRNGKAYLFDFGVSCTEEDLEQGSIDRGGTFRFSHPLQLGEGVTNVGTELYAFGQLLFFCGVSTIHIRDSTNMARYVQSSHLSPPLKELIVGLTDGDLSVGPQSLGEARTYLMKS